MKTFHTITNLFLPRRSCFQNPEVAQAEQKTEAVKQPEAQETPEQLHARIESAVKNEVGKEAGIVDRLQKDPENTAKVIETKILQDPTILAFMKTKPDLSKGAAEIQVAVKEQIQKTLQMAA